MSVKQRIIFYRNAAYLDAKFPQVKPNIPQIRGNSSFLRNLMIRFVHVRGDDKYYRQHKRRGKDWKFWSIERYPRLHELNGAIDGRFC